jgi:hypothetical protein
VVVCVRGSANARRPFLSDASTECRFLGIGVEVGGVGGDGRLVAFSEVVDSTSSFGTASS